jgi:hypothetical protein
LETEASAHAGLAVLAGHIAADRHVDRRAVAGDAGQRLGADVGALGAHVAVAGADHEALLDATAELVRQHRVIEQAQQHRLRVALGLAACGRIEAAEQQRRG